MTTATRLPRGQLIFVCVLVLVGVGFLGLSAYRAFNPPAPRVAPDLASETETYLEKRGFKPLSESLDKLVNDPSYKSIPTQAPLLLGQPAPDFTLAGVDGKPWSLSKNRAEGPVVLVFYLGYNCPHCVGQLKALSKDVAKFKELGARVVAVSPDTAEWTKQQYAKYRETFDFPVLSDPGNKVAERYGVFHPKPGGGEGDLMHGTFVIDRGGKVVWVNAGDEPFIEDRTLLVELARAEGRVGGK